MLIFTNLNRSLSGFVPLVPPFSTNGWPISTNPQTAKGLQHCQQCLNAHNVDEGVQMMVYRRLGLVIFLYESKVIVITINS